MNGRFPENLGQHYDNSAQNFWENIIREIGFWKIVG
jgi:hypothetical protein